MNEKPYTSKLVVLQVRLTHAQNDKLKTLREADGLSIQEHVRRAIDIYTSRVKATVKEAS